MSESLPASASHETIRTNGVELHALTAGPSDGDPVLLLHGFPEFWYGWRHQIPALSAAGYRVVVPDQRGYNRSDKPDGLGSYTVDELAADAVGVLDALGHDRAQFVGHDWGAGVVWRALLAHPDRVERAVTMNVPHPAVFEEFFRRVPSQWAMAWHMFFFQLPTVPELTWRLDDWRALRWFIDTSNREDTFTERDLTRYREAWSRPGAFRGMLNWYRALFRREAPELERTTVDRPTMVVWGTQDPYLHPEMAPASADRCSDGRLERFEDATHWIHHEIPDRVNDCLLGFLD